MLSPFYLAERDNAEEIYLDNCFTIMNNARINFLNRDYE